MCLSSLPNFYNFILHCSDTWYSQLSSNVVIAFMICLSVSCNCLMEVQFFCHSSDIWSKKTGCKSCDVWGSDRGSCWSWNSSGMCWCAIEWAVSEVLKAHYWPLDPEDESTTVLQTAGNYLPNNRVSHPIRMESSAPLLWNLKSCRVSPRVPHPTRLGELGVNRRTDT